jgi:hypothetical protein
MEGQWLMARQIREVRSDGTVCALSAPMGLASLKTIEPARFGGRRGIKNLAVERFGKVNPVGGVLMGLADGYREQVRVGVTSPGLEPS